VTSFNNSSKSFNCSSSHAKRGLPQFHNHSLLFPLVLSMSKIIAFLLIVTKSLQNLSFNRVRPAHLCNQNVELSQLPIFLATTSSNQLTHEGWNLSTSTKSLHHIECHCYCIYTASDSISKLPDLQPYLKRNKGCQEALLSEHTNQNGKNQTKLNTRHIQIEHGRRTNQIVMKNNEKKNKNYLELIRVS
jgi:hypothetical protein